MLQVLGLWYVQVTGHCGGRASFSMRLGKGLREEMVLSRAEGQKQGGAGKELCRQRVSKSRGLGLKDSGAFGRLQT